jgi:hypothetical protein
MKTYRFTIVLRDNRKVLLPEIQAEIKDGMLLSLQHAIAGRVAFTLVNSDAATGVQTTTVINGNHILDVLIEECA